MKLKTSISANAISSSLAVIIAKEFLWIGEPDPIYEIALILILFTYFSFRDIAIFLEENK